MKKKSPRKQRRIKAKAKTCYFTDTGKTPDFKDVLTLKRFITDRGKIMHQNYSGLTSRNQRKLSRAIKRARYMALLPYTDRHSM
ncbi:30S ribosomal protein S18 [Patescibacteria group bacterium]